MLGPSDGTVPAAQILARLRKIGDLSRYAQRAREARVRFRKIRRNEQRIGATRYPLPSHDAGLAMVGHARFEFGFGRVAPERKAEIVSHQSRHQACAGSAAVELLVLSRIVLVRVDSGPLLHPQRIYLGGALQHDLGDMTAGLQDAYPESRRFHNPAIPILKAPGSHFGQAQR